MYDEISPRNPRYLSIPTLLGALFCAHVLQGLTAPLELGALLSSLVYLIGLITPIVVKRVLTMDPPNEGAHQDAMPVPRLPTSRFPTVPGRPAHNQRSTITHVNS